MTAPQISVVIPAFNCASTLGSAIASALAQSVHDIEVIVVEDGSTDHTADVAWASDDPRLHMIRHERNLGTSAARNTGIAAARGELLAFLDSDDRWFPEKLETQLSTLARSTGPEVAGSVHSVMLEDRAGEFSPHLLPQDLDLRKDLMWGCRLCPGSSLLVTRECVDRVGPFDVALERLEDWDWLLRFAAHYRLAVTASPLAWVRRSSHRSRTQVCDALAHLRVKHAHRIAELDWVERRKLQSTLLVERASAEYRSGCLATAAITTACAMLRYPFRNRRFFRRLAEIAVECAPRQVRARAATIAKAGERPSP